MREWTNKLRGLAGVRLDNARVLSVYVDLDPSRFATPDARRSLVRSVLNEAQALYLTGAGPLNGTQRAALERDIERVRVLLEDELPAQGARSLAVFCAGDAGLFEVVKLPVPVESVAVVDASPYIEPLALLPDRPDWCVFLVNRRCARILRGTRERLEEWDSTTDDVPNRHDQGGWSQARYQRHIDQHATDHVRAACERLFKLYERRPFERLIVGTPSELWTEVQQVLHPYLHERLGGRIEVDVEHSSAGDVLRAAARTMDADEVLRERIALEQLAERLGRGERATAGPDGVLSALNEQRVEKVVLRPGVRIPGVCCPSCGWVGLGGRECPVDGAGLDIREDIMEAVTERALAQAAEIVMIRHHDELTDQGSIAALLRY
jgi:peptide subunit release factor 1 (eRF1)